VGLRQSGGTSTTNNIHNRAERWHSDTRSTETRATNGRDPGYCRPVGSPRFKRIGGER
jgi:hypothetical protein